MLGSSRKKGSYWTLENFNIVFLKVSTRCDVSVSHCSILAPNLLIDHLTRMCFVFPKDGDRIVFYRRSTCLTYSSILSCIVFCFSSLTPHITSSFLMWYTTQYIMGFSDLIFTLRMPSMKYIDLTFIEQACDSFIRSGQI